LAQKYGTDARRIFRDWARKQPTHEKAEEDFRQRCSVLVETIAETGGWHVPQGHTGSGDPVAGFHDFFELIPSWEKSGEPEEQPHWSIKPGEPQFSYSIINKYLERMLVQQTLRKERWERVTMTRRLRDIPSMEGAVYELQTIDLLIDAGVVGQVVIRPTDQPPPSMSKPLREGEPRHFKVPVLEHLYAASPGASDFDAFYVTEAYTVFFFQITISDKHPFSSHGVKSQMAHLATFFKKPLAQFDFFFIFVTKDDGRGRLLMDAETGGSKKVPAALQGVQDYTQDGTSIQGESKMSTVRLHVGYTVLP
jgi:hypothetical protein